MRIKRRVKDIFGKLGKSHSPLTSPATPRDDDNEDSDMGEFRGDPGGFNSDPGSPSTHAEDGFLTDPGTPPRHDADEDDDSDDY